MQRTSDLPIEFKQLIDQNNWIFAKTYAKTAPHEYIVKYKISKKWGKTIIDFAKFIRKVGYTKKFWNKDYWYYEYDGYKYWSMEKDLDKTILINREKL